MARKVINIANTATSYSMLSQTPKNYDKNNYFIKELQDKMDADWSVRPDVADIEYEKEIDSDEWLPIEVIVNSVLSDKSGSDVSDDCKRLIFRDIRESRFDIGYKFRFNSALNDGDKNIWLVSNTNRAKMTSSVVVDRCNGTLGSVYIDEHNISHYHYEPVVQGRELTGATLKYSETIVSPQSQLLVIAQYNSFTNAYKLNQRFIIGARQWTKDSDGKIKYTGGHVYKIKAINKFDSENTSNPEGAGLMRIYLEVTESSPYDDWDNRIASQDTSASTVSTNTELGYSLKLKAPEVMPTDLTSQEVTFEPIVVDSNGVEQTSLSIDIKTAVQLENFPSSLHTPTAYLETDGSFTETATGIFDINSLSNNVFTLKRKRLYINGGLIVTCTLAADKSPTSQDLVLSFKLALNEPEA